MKTQTLRRIRVRYTIAGLRTVNYLDPWSRVADPFDHCPPRITKELRRRHKVERQNRKDGRR